MPHGFGHWRVHRQADARRAPAVRGVKLPNASDEDLRDIFAFLRSDDPLVQPRDVDDHDSRPSFLTKVLARVAFRPFPYRAREIVAPPPEDKVAYGRYLVNSRFLCYGCHSRDFATNDDLNPEESPGYLGGGNAMPDIGGKLVYTANLTPDRETGIGGWTGEQFRRALKEGIRPEYAPLAGYVRTLASTSPAPPAPAERQ